MNRVSLLSALALTHFILTGCAQHDDATYEHTSYTPTSYSGAIPNYPEYTGTPYSGAPITIPGRIECEDYDLGGEGVAYHDNEEENLGVEASNSIWRTTEGPDTDFIRETSKGLETSLRLGEYYIGWCFPGEWLNYTLDVKIPGTYRMIAYYSASNENTQIQFRLNGEPATEPIALYSTRHVLTFTEREIGQIDFKSGLQVLTLEFLKQDMHNWNTIEFELVKGNY